MNDPITPLDSKPFRISMVEDNPADMRLMLEAIKIAGFKDVAVDTHYSSDEALEYFSSIPKSEKPDMVLLDLGMPRMSGTELLKELKVKNAFSDTVIYILSNSDWDKDQMTCKELGADGYVQKPTDFFGLVDFFASIQYSYIETGKAKAEIIDSYYHNALKIPSHDVFHA